MLVQGFLWKEKCWYWYEKARYEKHICVTDRHDMTLAVKVALNPNTTNQPTNKVFTLKRGTHEGEITIKVLLT